MFTFVEMKGMHVPEDLSDAWFHDLTFVMDLTAYSTELNLKLQGKDQLFHEQYRHVEKFQVKIRPWETQLRS
jgi:hypothetical protein